MKKTFYVTTPIFYPSGNLHIGHVFTTTLASALANYKTAQGYDVKMLTGADEHGQKIEQKAIQANIAPQQYVDQMTVHFKELWKKLEIDFDYYSRTTDPKHEKAIEKQFSELLSKDIIYKGKYKGLYSVQDEEFFTITQAVKKEDGKFYHPTSDHLLEEVEEETYFFRMSQFADWLISYYAKHTEFILPAKTIKELKINFLDKGLEDLSVTRSTFTWGISVKEDPKHVVYVWLDALNNYITALGYNSADDSDFQKYWVNGDEIVHIVGKEITRFHGIYWPIILKSLGLRQPTTVLSHGWIITKDGKMSKSKGNVIDPLKLLEKWNPEVLKYYFASQINIGADSVFTEERLSAVYNSELANNFGNLLSRTVAMFNQNFDTPVKFVQPTQDVDKNIIKEVEAKFDEFVIQMDTFNINKGLNKAIELSKELNGYIDITMPWTLKEDKERLGQVLVILLNGIYAVASMLKIVLPNKMNEATKQLAVDTLSFDEIKNFQKFDEITPVKGSPLFERIK